jgi:hypothetical protein
MLSPLEITWSLQLNFSRTIQEFIEKEATSFEHLLDDPFSIISEDYLAESDSLMTSPVVSSQEPQHLLIIGLGRGKWLDKLQQWIRVNPKGLIVIFEPHLALILHFLKSSIAAPWIHHPQIALIPSSQLLSSSFFDFDPQRPEFDQIARLLSQGTFKVLFHCHYQNNSRAKDLSKRLIYMIDDYRSICRESLLAPDKMAHCLLNFIHLKASVSHPSLHLDPQVPVILCGAGPSLTHQMKSLKNLRDKAFIVSCGTASMILEAYQVTPNLIAGVCPYPTHFERFKKHSFVQVPILSCLHVHPGVLQTASDLRIMIADLGGSAAGQFLERQLHLSYFGSDYGSSVLTAALKACYEMGARTFILVGSDLCYQETKKYAYGADEVFALDDQAQAQDVTTQSYHFKNGKGERVVSNYLWAFEKEWLERFIHEHFDAKIFQTTTDGLMLQGAFQLNLDQLSLGYLGCSYDLDSEIWQKFQAAKKEHCIDLESMYSCLQSSFEEVNTLCETALSSLEELFRDPCESKYEKVMENYYSGLKSQLTFEGFLNHIDWSIRAFQEASLWGLLKKLALNPNLNSVSSLAIFDAERVVVMQKRVNQLNDRLDQVAMDQGWRSE